MAEVYKKANKVAAKAAETKSALRRAAREVEGKARANLAATEHTPRITAEGYFPAEIDSAEHDVDIYVSLHAPNAMALEFGHSPSGFFADTDTKSPEPTHVLTKAAYS